MGCGVGEVQVVVFGCVNGSLRRVCVVVLNWVVNNTILLFLDGKNNCYSERRYLLLSE